MINLKSARLDFGTRERIISRISKESLTPEGYYFLLIISVIIITLGLFLNSPGVIIGGMIIAPMLNPIIAIGAAIITGDEKLLFKALRIVAISVGVAIAGSILVNWFLPIHNPTQEMLARTKPTIIDLIVALASGAAGAYAVTVRKGLVSMMGVAVAASIMPPLAVVGYGASALRFDIVGGAFLLFLANLIAIVVATVLVFYVLGFNPGRRADVKQVAKRDLLLTAGFFLVISVILGVFLVNTVKEANRMRIIEGELDLFLKPYDNTKVISLNEHKNVTGKVLEITIQSPSTFTQRATSILDKRLEQRLNEDINLQLLVIPATKLVDE